MLPFYSLFFIPVTTWFKKKSKNNTVYNLQIWYVALSSEGYHAHGLSFLKCKRWFFTYDAEITVLLHNGGFCNTALQNGACTYQCISKQMHYETPFSHNGQMKSL